MTLELWDFPRIKDPSDPHDRFAWLRRIARDFELRNPGVSVSITELTWKNGEEKLKIAAFAGTPPDLTSGPLPIRFIEAGLVEPVDGALTPEDRADYLPDALEAFRWHGRTWGFPWCMTGNCLFLNLDLFRARGVAPPEDGRWTFDEFRAAMRALSAGGQPGYAFCLEPGRTVEYGFAASAGGWPLAPDGEGVRAAVADPPFAAGIRFLADLVRDGAAPAESGGFKESDVWQGFLERRAYACVGLGIWAVDALQKKARFRFGVAHYPNRPGQPPVALNNVSGYYVMRRGDDPARRRLALGLARFITSAENQRVLALYKQFPTRRATGELYADQPAMRDAEKVVATGRVPPAHAAWPRMDAEIVTALQPIMLRSVPAGEGLSRLARRIDAIAAQTPRPRSAPDAAASGEADGVPAGWPDRARSAGRAADGAPAMPAVPPALAGATDPSAAWVWIALGAAGVMVLCALLAGRAARGFRAQQALLFLGPGMAVFFLFFLLPVLRGLLFSFQDVQPDPPVFGNWVGLENFRRVLADPHLLPALVNTLIYTAVVVPGNLLLALVLASLIQPLSGTARTFFKAAFYLPGVASVVVLAMVWRWLYDVNFGLINRVLAHGAFEPLYQLTANGLAIASHLGDAVVRVAMVLVPVFLVQHLLAARARREGPAAEAEIADRFSRIWPVALALAALAVIAMMPFRRIAPAPVRWLTSEDLSLFSVILSTLIRGPGGALIVYLAAMTAIPKELYEVARIDGAGPLRTWWEVTVPLLRPTTLYLAITQVVDSFQVFAQVLMLTDGGPGDSSVVLVHRVYTSAFRDLDFGAASALAFLLFLVLAGVSALQFRFFRGAWES